MQSILVGFNVVLHIQWHSLPIRFFTISWHYYQTWPFTELREVSKEHLWQVWHAKRRCKLQWTPGHVPFGTCIWSILVETNLFLQTCCDFVDFALQTSFSTLSIWLRGQTYFRHMQIDEFCENKSDKKSIWLYHRIMESQSNSNCLIKTMT